ncbi:MAG: hypothetical protein ACLUJG_19005 [Lawsonibacter sp.]
MPKRSAIRRRRTSSCTWPMSWRRISRAVLVPGDVELGVLLLQLAAAWRSAAWSWHPPEGTSLVGDSTGSSSGAAAAGSTPRPWPG